RVNLHAERDVPGQLHQPVEELVDHHEITFRLLSREERVQLGEFRPGDRDHLSRGDQLHGAGAQRDHRLVQLQIFTFQRVHVTHHLGFAVIAVEHRVSQDRVVAQHAFLNGAAVERNLFVERINVQTLCVTQQYVEQGQDIVTGGAFVQRNADRIVNVAAQVDL